MSTPGTAPTVLWDLDNTLHDLAKANRVWFTFFDAAHGLDGRGVDWGMRRFAEHGFRSGTLVESFTQAHGLFGLPEPVEYLTARYRHELPGLCELRPEVRQGLLALRGAGVRQGIVTGGCADMQTLKIVHLGLAELVDGWTPAAVAGMRKPDLGLFTRAVIEAGGRVQDGGWVIGNSPHADILGGHALGFSTIWIDHGNPWPPEIRRPAHQVGDVAEAFTIVLSALGAPADGAARPAAEAGA